MGERASVVVDVLMRASWAERRERVGRRWVRRRMEEVVMVLFLLAWVRLYGLKLGVYAMDVGCLQGQNVSFGLFGMLMHKMCTCNLWRQRYQ